MKANINIAIAAITLGISLVSCNKVANWRCECSENGDPVAAVDLDATKKKEAKAVCSELEKDLNGAKCKLDKE